MNLLNLLVVIVVVGVLVWAVNQYVPMQAQIKTIFNVVAALFLVLWLLQSFGILGTVGHVRIH